MWPGLGDPLLYYLTCNLSFVLLFSFYYGNNYILLWQVPFCLNRQIQWQNGSWVSKVTKIWQTKHQTSDTFNKQKQRPSDQSLRQSAGPNITTSLICQEFHLKQLSVKMSVQWLRSFDYIGTTNGLWKLSGPRTAQLCLSVNVSCCI